MGVAMKPLNAHQLHMQDAPAWYDLSPSNDGIIISVHPAEYDDLMTLLRTTSAQDFVGDQKVGPFISPDERAWGFGSTIVTGALDERGWRTINCEFPKPVRDEFPWERLYTVSFTLQLVFDHLNAGGNKTAESRRQCFSVALFTGREAWGGGIGAKLSPSTVRWLRSIDQPVIDRINADMARLGQRLFGPKFARKDEFQVWLRSDGIPIFNCPGDACDLSPTGDNYDPGCELSPHNTDTPMQQLTLLAGLAALCQEARKAGI